MNTPKFHLTVVLPSERTFLVVLIVVFAVRLNDPELAAPLLLALEEYGGVWTEAPPAPDFEPTCSA